MAIGGGDYELTATFRARVDPSVGRAFRTMEQRLAAIEKKMNSLDREDASPELGLNDKEFQAKAKKASATMKDLDGKDVEAQADLDITALERKLKTVNRDLDKYRRRKDNATVGVDDKQAKARLAYLHQQLIALSTRTWNIEMSASERGFSGVEAKAIALNRQVENLDGEVINIRADLDAGGAIAGLTLLSTALNKAGGIGGLYARNIYIAQQATQGFIAALAVLAIAASGPVLAGLTILGTTLLSVAGGFGLVAAAALPVLSVMSNYTQNAKAVTTAQDSLRSSTDSLASAQSGLADAQRGVADAQKQGAEGIRQAVEAHKDAIDGIAEAQRSGQEAIQSAIDAHADALDGIADAQASYADAQRSTEDAQESLTDATEDYNDALATEQYRLRSMQYDLEGMALSQKQLALDLKEAQKELAEAESPEERKQAQLRIAEIQLQQKQNTLDMTQAEKELTEARKNGTDELQGAKDAQDAAKDSVESAKRAELDALKAIGDARSDAKDAFDEIAKARAQATRDVQEAREQEEEAARAIKTAQEEAARGVQDAMRAVADAQRAVAQAQADVAANQDKLNLALSKIPAYAKPALDAFADFREEYYKSFENANKVAALLIARLLRIGQSVLPQLGRASVMTMGQVGKAITRIGRGFEEQGGLSSFQRILNSIPGITGKISTAMGRFGVAFLNIMGQSMPYVRQFARWLSKISQDFLKWTHSKRGRQEIHRFFESAAPLARVLWKWIKEIAGGILSWSIRHPREVANALNSIFLVGKKIFGIIVGVYKLFNRMPGLAGHPIRVVTAMLLVWFGKMLLIRGAIKLLGLAFGPLSAIVRRVVGQMVVMWVAGMKTLLRATATAMLAMGRIILAQVMQIVAWFTRGLGTMLVGTGGFIRGVLLLFGRLTIIGMVIWTLVNVFIQAYTEIINHTIPTIRGLYNMWRQGQLSIGQLIFNIWRQIMASWVRIILGTLVAMIEQMKSLFVGFFNWLGNKAGIGDLGNKIFGDWDGTADNVRRGMDKVYNAIRGGTNKSAEAMGKGMDQMANATKKSLGGQEKNTKSSMSSIHNTIANESKKASQQGSSYMDDLRAKSTKSMTGMKNEGSKNITGLKTTGLKELDSLRGGGLGHIGNLKTGGLGSIDDLRGGGLSDLSNLKTGGVGSLDSLRGEGMAKAAAMQLGVNRSTTTTKEKGIAAIQDLQQQGTAAMSVLQEDWVAKAWDTSVQTQQSFNAILEGMSKFIENSGVSGVKKPSQFDIVGRTGGNIAGEANNKGLVQGHVDKRYRGGVDKFARGGPATQPPIGGVATNQTVRVFGEIPGTNEYYITNNPAYRKRNLGILQQAAKDIMGSGGTKKFAAGGIQPWDNVGGDRRLSVGVESPELQGLVSQAAKGWNSLGANVEVSTGGGDVVFRMGPAGGNAGLTWSNGLTEIAPGYANAHVVGHEMGHSLKHAHIANSIMGTAGSSTQGLSKLDAQLHQQIWGASTKAGKTPTTDKGTIPTGGGGGGGGGGRAGGAAGGQGGGSASTRHLTARGGQGGGSASTSSLSVQASQSGGSAGGDSKKRALGQIAAAMDAGIGINVQAMLRQSLRKAGHTKKRHGHGRPSHAVRRGSRRDLFDFALGGILETGGQFTSPRQNLAAADMAAQGGEARRRMAMGGMRSYKNRYGATYNWEPWVEQIARDVTSHVQPTSANTYPNHGGRGVWGEMHSVDYWGPAGRADPVTSPVGSQVESYNLSKHRNDIMYYIWEGIIHGWGSSKPYSDPSDQHFDHLHSTYDQGANLSGGDAGGNTPDYQSMFDKFVPKMASGLNYGKVGEASMARGNAIRDKIAKWLVGKTSAGEPGGTYNGGGSLDEWIKQGTIFGNALDPTSANLSAIKGRAMQESGGDPNAVNDWDSNAQAGTPSKGLLQIIGPTWGTYQNQYGQSAGSFDSNWMNPIKNTGVGTRYMKDAYGHVVGPSGTGYRFGGLTRKAQFGMLHANEMNVPLDDHRAVRALDTALARSRRAGGMPEESGTGIGASPDAPVHVKMHDDDINHVAALVLNAIWAGLDSPKGGEKMDNNLGRRWEVQARRNGEM